jgi:hypothetical protein
MEDIASDRTNVRQESDVDICVLYNDAFYPNYTFSEGLSDTALEFKSGGYSSFYLPPKLRFA